MAGLWDKIRTGTDRAMFEADKIKQIASLQSTIKGLHDEVDKGLGQLGIVTYELYRAEQIPHPELQKACQQLEALYAQIATHERDLEEVRQRVFVEAAHAAQYGHRCPNGHGELPAQNRFCHICGAAAKDDEPPPSAVELNLCRSCGNQLAKDARFCTRCGQPVVSLENAGPATEPGKSASIVERTAAADGEPAVEAPAVDQPPLETVEETDDLDGAEKQPSDETAFPEERAAPEIEATETVVEGERTLPVVSDSTRALTEVEPGEDASATAEGLGETMVPAREDEGLPDETVPVWRKPALQPASFCSVCGGTLLPGNDFCANCGHSVETG